MDLAGLFLVPKMHLGHLYSSFRPQSHMACRLGGTPSFEVPQAPGLLCQRLAGTVCSSAFLSELGTVPGDVAWAPAPGLRRPQDTDSTERCSEELTGYEWVNTWINAFWQENSRLISFHPVRFLQPQPSESQRREATSPRSPNR